jgi:hypothetical protein
LIKTYVNSATGRDLPGVDVEARIVFSKWFTMQDLESDDWTLSDDESYVYRRATSDENGDVIFWDIPADSVVELEILEAPEGFEGNVGQVEEIFFGEDDDPDTVDVGECPSDRGEGYFAEVVNELDSEGQIIGFVFSDSNGNDTPEPGLGEGDPGVRVYLYECEGALVTSTVTDAEGRYVLDRLDAGWYQVVVNNVFSECFYLEADEKERRDFDNSADQKWIDRDPDPEFDVDVAVWEDDNNNGDTDTGETRHAGVTVQLWRSNQTLAGEDVTNGGDADFDSHIHGWYRLCVLHDFAGDGDPAEVFRCSPFFLLDADYDVNPEQPNFQTDLDVSTDGPGVDEEWVEEGPSPVDGP